MKLTDSILTNEDKKRISNAALNIPELSSAGIRFIDSKGQDNFQLPSTSPKIWVCIKTEEKVGEVTSKTPTNIQNKELRDINNRAPKVAENIASTGISCATAIFAGLATVGTVAAAAPTGGASVTLTAIAWTGYAASATSCGIGLGKIVNDLLDPKNNEILDESEWFKTAEKILETTSDIADVISIGNAGKKLLEYSKVSGKSLVQVFKGELSRNERHQIAKWLHAKNSKLGSNKAIKAEFKELVKSGKINNRISLEEISKVKEKLLEVVNKAAEYLIKNTAQTFILYILVEE